MAASALAKKLRIQAGQRVLILNAPERFIETLGELPADVEVAQKPEGEFDFVHLFVKNSQELGEMRASATEAVKYDGMLWISYPKRSSRVETDLTRDVLWRLMEETGLRPVFQVSVDKVWSAMRLRPAEKVRSK